jgi:hypothetical protein
MTPRPVPDTVESLRVALQKLDHPASPAPFESSFAHARQTLLLRLADAEAEVAIIESLGLAIPESLQTPETDTSRSALSLAEIEALEETSQEIPLYKLN